MAIVTLKYTHLKHQCYSAKFTPKFICIHRCGNVNFARRTSCNRCGRGELFFMQIITGISCWMPLLTTLYTHLCYLMLFCVLSTEKTTEAKMMKAGGTEIGKTLAEKSRGLFSANDWQCKTYVLANTTLVYVGC